MENLQRGQKLKWESLSPSKNLQVGLSGAVPGSTLDFSCFGVDAQDQLSDDRYFIFYNQKVSPCGALTSLGSSGDDSERYTILLGDLPSTIRRLVFVITIDGSGSMSALQDGYWRLYDTDGVKVAEFPFRGSDFADEKAIIAGEIYYKDAWRVAAVGQGFNGGLSALLRHFGGEESEDISTAAATAQAPPLEKLS
ncbi:MAG: stress protein, partial [Verrucomicrobiaceae bacterium]